MEGTRTRETLRKDLAGLGVSPGDILFVHSSFKSLGPVEGGAQAAVLALEDAVGPNGTILMPSFNLVAKDIRASSWNVRTTPSTVGWLTEFFRSMPGTVRSDHYSHSVAARGAHAEEFVSGHLKKEGLTSPWDLDPWGFTYGTHSPMWKAYEAGGKVLMLGVNYHSSTYMHVVEVLFWHHLRRTNPAADYFWIDRDKIGEYWDSLGRLNRGKVGQADCRLFPIRSFVDTLVQAGIAEPARWFKWWKA